MPAVSEPKWAVAKLLFEMERSTYNGGQRFVFRRVGNQGLAKGRNILTHMARCSGASEMIMMDADIVPQLGSFFALLSHPEEFLSAMYLKKEFPLSWVGDFQAAPEKPNPQGIYPMDAVGGGFVKVSLHVVDLLVNKFPDRGYESDEVNPEMGLAAGQWMHDLWGMGVVKDDWGRAGRTFARYQTEDYFFSWLYRQAGGRVWANVNCRVGHVGAVDWLKLSEFVQAERERAVADYVARLGEQV